ncbi:MAG: hypothetical protein M0Z46_10815 [Actinomycetota bacterium]|nr:hypothetical protein [Actinomycetota bacterium]
MDTIPTHLRRFDDPLIDESSKTAADTNLGPAYNQLGDFAYRHGVARCSEDREDWPVEGRRDGPSRIR